MSSVPSGDMETLLRLFRESDWREMHLQADGVTLFLSKDGNATLPGLAAPGSAPAPVAPPVAAPPAVPVPAAPSPSAASGVSEAPAETGIVVRASSLGTFYRSPKPGAPPFCEAGQRVEADSQLCLIEVMKLFTTVRAGCAGTIREICVADGDMVEFDQPLFVIDPDA